MVEKELKKGHSDFDSGSLIEATAESEAIERIKAGSTTKPVYLIRISSSVIGDKERVFVSEKLTETNNYLQITGVEVLSKNKPNKTQKIDRTQVLDNADRETVIDIRFPWHKINEIQNVSYQHKVQNKGK